MRERMKQFIAVLTSLVVIILLTAGVNSANRIKRNSKCHKSGTSEPSSS